MEPRLHQQPLHIPSAVIEWLRSEYEERPNYTLKKSALYEAYEEFCGNRKMRPKDPNTFGKMVLRVFPQAFTRRLGPLKAQVAHYSGIAPRADDTTSLTDFDGDLELPLVVKIEKPSVALAPPMPSLVKPATTTTTRPTTTTTTLSNIPPVLHLNRTPKLVASAAPTSISQSNLNLPNAQSNGRGLALQLDQDQLLQLAQQLEQESSPQSATAPSLLLPPPALPSNQGLTISSMPLLNAPMVQTQPCPPQDMELELLVQQLINDGDQDIPTETSLYPWG